MLPNKRRVEGLTFSENATTEVRLPRGFLETGLVLSVAFTDTISVIATAARARGTPIKSISVVADGGKVLQSYRPSDAIRHAEIYEQTALANICAPPTLLTVAAHTGTCDIPILFAEPFAGDDGILTALPSWIYDELILRVEWGGHAQLYVGGTGVVTVQSLTVTANGVQADFSNVGEPAAVWGRKMGRSVTGFREVAAPAAVNTDFQFELPRTADIRSLMIVTEDANGQPVETILSAVTLEINNSLRQFARVPARMLRSENAKVFGVSMPTGTYLLEFAEDQVIGDVLEAGQMTALNLILDVAAVAGTIRVARRTIEAGPGVAA